MATILRTIYDQGEVNEGETRLLSFLEKKLPSEYVLVPNVQLPHRNPRNQCVEVLEYDCIVVAPHAVYHLENKHWIGRLTGDDRDWQLNGRSKGNPLRTCAFKSKVLASKLKEYDASWGRAWVASAITLSHPSMAAMQLDGASADAAFTLDKGLSEFLMDPERARSEAGKIADLRDPIARYLSGQQAPAKRPKRVFENEYEIVEILSQHESKTEYLVKPRGIASTIYRKVNEYAVALAYLSDDERRRRLGEIKNQYRALRQIANSPYILHVEFYSDDEHGYFYEIADYLEESTLRVELTRRTLTFRDRLTVLRNVAQGLRTAHAGGVYHREVCPDNIYLSADGSAFLANFGKSYYADTERQGYTLFPTVREEELSGYMPPEMARPHDADSRTDVYGWGMTAYETLVGDLPRYPTGEPLTNWHDLDHFGGKLQPAQLPTTRQPELPAWTNELVDRCLRLDAEERFTDMNAVLTFIDEATARNISEGGAGQARVAAAPVQPEHRDIEEVRQGDKFNEYLLIEQIGRGGYSEVWRVKHTIQSREYAMKLFNPSVQIDSVLDEYRALTKVEHPNVVRFTWNGRLSNGRFFTLMELLEGDCLRDYVYGNPPLGMTLANIYRAGVELSKALVYLHGLNILHRDIKPHNIIWHRQEKFVLIDFNVASIQQNFDRVGTDPYAAPDKVQDNHRAVWDDSCDTFALGVTLYELVCHTHPYKGNQPMLNRVPADPTKYNDQISEAFAQFLLRAVQPRTADRFATAADMLSALEAIGLAGLNKPVAVAPESSLSTEAFVDELNKLFSQSKYNNTGTRASTIRGLDRFARDTYIETKLDTELKRAILDGVFRLVIITGNAGDGKTAFIQRLEEELQADSRAQFSPLPTGNGARFRIKNIPFRSNYDGSQDESGQENDSVLDEFFQPFANLANFDQAAEGRLVAINEGRLVEYLQHRNERLGHLGSIVEQFFYNESTTPLPAGLLIINLNVRAVVSADNTPEESLFRKQVRAFVQPKHWQGCADCTVRESCFIRFNVQTLNDPAVGSEIISRMEDLLRTVHFRRDLHITMRDMRSLLAFWLTRDYSCAEVRRLVASPRTLDWLSKHYYNLTADQADRGNQDRLVRLLRDLDVGRSVVPALDRALFFSTLTARNYLAFDRREGDLLATLNQVKNELVTDEPEHPLLLRRFQQLLARHQYFEGRFYQPGNASLRNPYRSVAAFGSMVSPITVSSTMVSPADDRTKVLQRAKESIATAIARLEGCTNADLARLYVVQAAGRPDPLFASYRLFKLADFELIEDHRPNQSRYMEYLPDKLIFRHAAPANRHIALTISLDLFEMLYFIQKGYAPSLDDLKGRFVEYQVFRNMLANLPYRKVVVTNNQEDFVAIEADEHNRLLIHSEIKPA